VTRSGSLVAQSPAVVDNAAIAELLIREAKTAEGHREQAFRRAAHAAFMWPEEGTDIVAAGRARTELAGIGHSLAKRLHNWIASPPEQLGFMELSLAVAARRFPPSESSIL
jgi:DNA polymerase/3'-5' exonuclease PolX